MAGTQSLWLGAVLLVGCGFEAAPLEEDMEPVPPGTIDPSIERKCATSDNSLRLCIDFEDTATLAGDGSGRGHHPVIADALITMDRATELAVQMSTQSRLQIQENADLDITTNLTISMWADNDGLPQSGASFWMLDNNKQYSMSLQADGRLRCGLGSSTVDSATALNLFGGGWHQVACTYDGNQLKVFVDGWVAGCSVVGRPIATTGTEGLAIGANIGAGTTAPLFTSRFVGGLDNVQVFARTWSDRELCDAAGDDWCTSGCGGGGGGEGGEE